MEAPRATSLWIKVSLDLFLGALGWGLDNPCLLTGLCGGSRAKIYSVNWVSIICERVSVVCIPIPVRTLVLLSRCRVRCRPALKGIQYGAE